MDSNCVNTHVQFPEVCVTCLGIIPTSSHLPNPSMFFVFCRADCFSMFLDTMMVQSTRDLFLGTLLVSVISAVSVEGNPFASLPLLSAPRIYLPFKGKIYKSDLMEFYYMKPFFIELLHIRNITNSPTPLILIMSIQRFLSRLCKFIVCNHEAMLDISLVRGLDLPHF